MDINEWFMNIIKIPTEEELIKKNIEESFEEIYKVIKELRIAIKDLQTRCDNLRFLMDR